MNLVMAQPIVDNFQKEEKHIGLPKGIEQMPIERAPDIHSDCWW